MSDNTTTEPTEGSVRITAYGEAYTRVDWLPNSDARWWVAPGGDYPHLATVAITWGHLLERGPLVKADDRLTETVNAAVRDQLAKAAA